MGKKAPVFVIPAKAGIQIEGRVRAEPDAANFAASSSAIWTPAFAGVTKSAGVATGREVLP
jgi:hypothetical protein